MKVPWFQVLGGALLLASGIVIGMQVASPLKSAKTAERPVERLTTPQPRSEGAAGKSARLAGGSKRQGERAEDLVSRPALSAPEAQQIAKPWIEAGLQLGDEVQRQDAIASIRKALQSDDLIENYAALMAFLGLSELEFDKKSFREQILPHLEAGDPEMRRQSWYALWNADPRPEDIERIWEMAEEPGMERSVSHLLMLWEERDLTGKSGAVVERLLHHDDAAVRKEVMRGLWGGRYSEELSARVVELADPKNEASSGDALYFALSTQANKTAEGVKRLIEYLSHPDTTNVAGRALWGLNSGVPEESYPCVAEAAIELVESRGGRIREGAIGLLMRYARPEQRPELEALLAMPGLDAGTKASLAELVEGMTQ